jgi:hypothetical protein
MLRNFTLLFLIATSVLTAQNAEGIYLKFGINTANIEWQNARNLFGEFSDLRPWLDRQPVVSDKAGGWNIGYGVGNKWFYAEMNYMSNRMHTRYQGVDSSGNEIKGSYMLINRTLTLGGGIKLIPTPYFRIGIFAGISANPFVIKDVPNEVLKQRLAAFFLMPLLFTKYSSSPLDSKFTLAGKLSASVQIGGNFGVTVEPYYLIPFWNTDLNSTRFKLNGFSTDPGYAESDFKTNMKFWGIKFCAYIGYSG